MVRHFISINNRQTVNKDICNIGTRLHPFPCNDFTFVRTKYTRQNERSFPWHDHFDSLQQLLRCSDTKNDKKS